MENTQKTLLYKSHDFYLSAICLAAGLNLLRLEQGDGKFSVFVFDDPQNIAPKIIADHWNRKNLISSRDLIEAINELRTRLYSRV